MSATPSPLPEADASTPPVVRRPPRHPDTLASVTQLTPPGGRGPVPLATVQGALALDLDLDQVPRPPAPDGLRVVPGAREEDREVQVWAARFAQATVEVISGDRPVSQLLRMTSTRVYADLDRRLRVLGRRVPPTPAQRARRIRPQVRSVHVCRPAAEVAEVSVHVRHGHRSRALAARLEQRDGRWVCVALQLG